MAEDIELPTKSKQDDIYNKIDDGIRAIESIQRGVYDGSLEDESDTISISSVDKSKSTVKLLSIYGGDDSFLKSLSLSLEKEDEIKIKVKGKNSSTGISWEVIEFK